MLTSHTIPKLDVTRPAPAPGPTDFELVALASTDTREGQMAYGTLVARHRPALVRHLTHVLRNESDAQDAAQETFARAHAALRRCPPDRNVAAWLRMVATRVAYNYTRAENTRRRYHDRVETGGEDGDRDERRQYVQRLLETLHPAEQEVLILRHVEEWSVEEIAKHLGIGVSATKMRLLRARKSMLARHGELASQLVT